MTSRRRIKKVPPKKKTLVQQRERLQKAAVTAVEKANNRIAKTIEARLDKFAAATGGKKIEPGQYTFIEVEPTFEVSRSPSGPAHTLVNIATSAARSQWGTGWRMLPEETRKAYVCRHVARCITENCNKVSTTTALEALMLAQLPPNQ